MSTPLTKSETASSNGYHYHIEPVDRQGPLADRFLTVFAAILRHSNYRFLLEMYSRSSTRCARCAVTCQVYQATGNPRDVPCYRTNLLLDVYRRHFTPSGWLRGRFLGNGNLTEDKIHEMAELFYRCTACRRCGIECPMGIDHGLISHLGRYILSEAGIAPKGLVVSVREQLEGVTKNTSAVPLPALLDNLEFLEEELEEMKGVQVAFPVDQLNAEYIFFPAVSDYLMEADTLMGNAAALQAAGVQWTIGSGYFDGINYGLFYNDWILERILDQVSCEAKRLNAAKVMIGECGHASRSAREFLSAFNRDGSLQVVNILEVTAHAIREGRIRLDLQAVPEKVTYHDPCNVARSGWLVDAPRQILRSFVSDFVEMEPHGVRNYCCGGGGGLVSLDETHNFRMQVLGKTKADQIRATGAKIVATPCANCKKQLRELVDYYDLPVEVVGVHDLLLRAIVL